VKLLLVWTTSAYQKCVGGAFDAGKLRTDRCQVTGDGGPLRFAAQAALPVNGYAVVGYKSVRIGLKSSAEEEGDEEVETASLEPPVIPANKPRKIPTHFPPDYLVQGGKQGDL
jgi:hypothetical protein